MRALILNVPTAVFIIFIFSPIIILLLSTQLGITAGVDTIFTGRLIPELTLLLWSASLTDYMAQESKTNDLSLLIYPLIITIAIIQGYQIYLNQQELTLRYSLIMDIISGLIFLISVILQTKLVKRVFYARTTWFLFMELFIIPIGVFNLTPTVREWEDSDKK